jgi:hypothetical protein
MTNLNLSEIPTPDLYEYLRNALTTSCRAIGHTKSHMNGVMANQYRDELNIRGQGLPCYDLNQILIDDGNWRSQQIAAGTYNGAGSV